jgi:hypothetical protein
MNDPRNDSRNDSRNDRDAQDGLDQESLESLDATGSPTPERDVVDRRAGTDRRQKARDEAGYDGPERRVGARRTGLERRRGAGIRREEDRRSAEEGEMTAEQFEFVQAIEQFKHKTQTPYPTWLNILDLTLKLGYRGIAPPTIDLGAAKNYEADLSSLTPEQANFVRAIEAYKTVNKKRFPTWTEVLEVVEQLGYRKVHVRSIDLPSVPEAPIAKAA